MRIDQVMTFPIVVDPLTPIGVCASVMMRCRLQHLPVIGPHGRLMGMISDHVLLLRGSMLTNGSWMTFDPREQDQLARDLQQPAPLVVSRSSDAREVLCELSRRGCDVAMVVDDGMRPLGIFTQRHALEVVAPQCLPDTRPGPHGRMQIVACQTRAHDLRSRMIREGTRHVLVASETGLFGVVSVRDVARELALPPGARAEDLVPWTPLVYAQAPVGQREAALRMVAEKLEVLPVVDEHLQPVQCIERAMLLRQAAAALDSQRATRAA